MALSYENSSDISAPNFLNGSQNAQFVVDQNVMVCRIALRDVLQLELFVDIDQHGSCESIIKSRPANLMWLKDDISVRKNYRHGALLDTIHDLKRIGKQTLMERIFQEEMRNSEHVQISRIAYPVTLKGAEVICVPDFGPQLFENRPVALCRSWPTSRSK